MKAVELPDEIAHILEKVPAAERGDFLIDNGFRIPHQVEIKKLDLLNPPDAFQLFTDGASRGNPGKSGAGFVIKEPSGEALYEGKEYLGTMTNNVSEWTALLLGLQKCLELGIRKLTCFLDSELVVKQMKGEYKIKHESLQVLANKVKKIVADFSEISFQHIPREKNTVADRLSNEAIDEQ